MSNGQLKVPSENTFGNANSIPNQEGLALAEQKDSLVSQGPGGVEAFDNATQKASQNQLNANQLSTAPASAPSSQAGQGAQEGGEEQPIKISIGLPTNAYFASGIRDFCMTLARNISGFSKQWAYRFQSVVDELINNAIEFGSKPGDEIKITFISVEHKYIEVLVEDNGTGKNGLSAAQITAFVKERENLDAGAITSMRGRGLSQIVSKWADSLEFRQNEKGGITACVVKNFQKDEEMVIPL